MDNKEMIILRLQGLEASVRNKLGPAKNIPALLKAYEKELDPAKKESLFNFLKKEVEKLEKSISLICDYFPYFDIKQKPPH